VLSGRTLRVGHDLRAMDVDRVRHDVQRRLREQRSRLPVDLVAAFDSLLARRGFLSEERAALSHPLGHPLVTFPFWVADAIGDTGSGSEARQLDLVEATVTGYLYVRVHDDRLDEGLGDPDEALFLAHSFLVRHQALLARHVGSSPRFWTLFEHVASDYATAMLLERTVMRPGATYGAAEFDRVLRRSHPLVLPGAALLDIGDRWDLLEPVRRFVHHAVRSSQLVDDLLDCELDRSAGRLTWIVRRLGGEEGPRVMARRLIEGGVDEIVAEAETDIDAARTAAVDAGMRAACEWLDDRRRELSRLHERIVLRFLLG
jgi:hypothetical protein